MADAGTPPPPSFDPPKGVDASVKIPLQSVPRLHERDVIEKCRRYYGHPVVAVEMTEESFADCLEETKAWFIDNWGIVRFRVYDTPPGLREIVLTDDVKQVQEISFESLHIPSIVFERDFPFFANQPARSTGGVMFSYPHGLYSGIVQQLQWIEQLKRIFSADPDWEFDPLTHVLRLFGQAGGGGGRRMMVEYISNSMQIEELFGEALNTFQRYFRAEVGERLGQIRSKYDSIPVAGGTASLNGTALLEASREDKEKLTELAHNRNYPYRFLTG